MNDDEKYEKAKKRLEDVKEFYSDLMYYVVINTFLFIINFVFTPGTWWFLFPLVIWGIILLSHFLGLFIIKDKIFGKDWEERKIQKYMEDEK